MSENYSRHPKTSRRHKEETSKRKNQDFKKYETEAKTPPLPKNRHSIQELMRQRESLKEELEKLEAEKKSNKIKSSTESNKRKHSEEKKMNTKISKRDLEYSHRTKTKSRGMSPDYNAEKYLDSEDEESIIEQRRKQRKQLIEKLNVTNSNKNNENNYSNIAKSEHRTAENSQVKHLESSIKKNLPQKENNKQLSDMFSEKDDFVPQNMSGARDTKDEHNPQLTDNWDDPEGYYIIKAGEVLKNKYVLKEVLGQGVFANVIHAKDNTKKNASVAIKIVRNNDLMYKTSLKEISILKKINETDPENKYHCVKYICNFMHKGHLCIVLEALHMDLRSILKKYGKNHGIHMKALISYSRQLLLALRLLKKIGIVHADIKPDNILVNEKKNVLKLCDYGSAAKLEENEPTPYLVSRFYRAPEIILGIPYNHSIDIWSSACTLYEMATGRILFTGSSNNRMLKCFMDLKGKIPVKMIRKGKFKDQHFNYNNNFLLHKKDEFTGRDKVMEVLNHNPTRDLYKELQKSYKNLSTSEEKKLVQLKDLIEKMLLLDPNQRLKVSDCLRHLFIQEELKK